MWTPAPSSQGGYIRGKLWISPQRKQWQVFVQQPAGHHLPIGPRHASLEDAKHYAALIPNPAGIPMKRASKLNPKAAFHVYHPDYSGYGIEYKRKLRHPGYGDTAGMPTGEPYDVKVGSRAFPSIAAAKAWIDTQDHAQRVKEHEARSRRKNPIYKHRVTGKVEREYIDLPDIPDYVSEARRAELMAPYVKARKEMDARWAADGYYPLRKSNPTYKHPVTGKLKHVTTFAPRIPAYMEGDEWEPVRMRIHAEHAEGRREEDQRWAAAGYRPIDVHGRWQRRQITGPAHPIPNPRDTHSYGAAKGSGAHAGLFEAWYTDEMGRRRVLKLFKSATAARKLAKKAHDELAAYAAEYGGMTGLRKAMYPKANPGRLDVEFHRRLPALVIVGTTSARARALADEVRTLMDLPRLRVVVSGAAGHSAAEIAAAIQAKMNRS